MKQSKKDNLIFAHIWNCKNVFKTKCPLQWDRLESTEDPDVKYCSVCKESVYQSNTAEEFIKLGNDGYCVSIPEDKMPAYIGMGLMGRVSKDALDSNRIRSDEVIEWWSTVIGNGANFCGEGLECVKDIIEKKGRG